MNTLYEQHPTIMDRVQNVLQTTGATLTYKQKYSDEQRVWGRNVCKDILAKMEMVYLSAQSAIPVWFASRDGGTMTYDTQTFSSGRSQVCFLDIPVGTGKTILSLLCAVLELVLQNKFGTTETHKVEFQTHASTHTAEILRVANLIAVRCPQVVVSQWLETIDNLIRAMSEVLPDWKARVLLNPSTTIREDQLFDEDGTPLNEIIFCVFSNKNNNKGFFEAFMQTSSEAVPIARVMEQQKNEVLPSKTKHYSFEPEAKRARLTNKLSPFAATFIIDEAHNAVKNWTNPSARSVILVSASMGAFLGIPQNKNAYSFFPPPVAFTVFPSWRYFQGTACSVGEFILKVSAMHRGDVLTAQKFNGEMRSLMRMMGYHTKEVLGPHSGEIATEAQAREILDEILLLWKNAPHFTMMLQGVFELLAASVANASDVRKLRGGVHAMMAAPYLKIHWPVLRPFGLTADLALMASLQPHKALEFFAESVFQRTELKLDPSEIRRHCPDGIVDATWLAGKYQSHYEEAKAAQARAQAQIDAVTEGRFVRPEFFATARRCGSVAEKTQNLLEHLAFFTGANSDKACGICLTAFDSSKPPCLTACCLQTQFCADCIRRWRRDGRSCPACRQQAPTLEVVQKHTVEPPVVQKVLPDLTDHLIASLKPFETKSVVVKTAFDASIKALTEYAEEIRKVLVIVVVDVQSVTPIVEESLTANQAKVVTMRNRGTVGNAVTTQKQRKCLEEFVGTAPHTLAVLLTESHTVGNTLDGLDLPEIDGIIHIGYSAKTDKAVQTDGRVCRLSRHKNASTTPFVMTLSFD